MGTYPNLTNKVIPMYGFENCLAWCLDIDLRMFE